MCFVLPEQSQITHRLHVKPRAGSHTHTVHTDSRMYTCQYKHRHTSHLTFSEIILVSRLFVHVAYRDICIHVARPPNYSNNGAEVPQI